MDKKLIINIIEKNMNQFYQKKPQEGLMMKT